MTARGVARLELVTLGLVFLAALSSWAFVAVGDEVIEGDTRAVDEWILLSLRRPEDLSDPIGPHWVEELARDITSFGGIGPLTLFTLLSATYLLLRRKRRIAALLIVSVGGGVALSVLLKGAFERPRPDLVPHGQRVYSASFPSGHSMLSAVTYLTLGALLARVQRRRTEKLFFLVVAVVLTLCVGITRVYLGVHWPSDVLAGWSAGAAWACICWLCARQLQIFGKVEGDALS